MVDPQTIGIIGFIVFFLWVPTLTLAAVFMLRRLRTQERVRAIEQGHEVTFDAEVSALRTRRAGVVLVAAAMGIVAADAIVTWATGDLRALGFLALATVPLAVGLGLLFDHRTQLRDVRQRKPEDSSRGIQP